MALSLILLPRVLPVLSETTAVNREGPMDSITYIGSDGTKWKQIDIFSPPSLAAQSTLQCVKRLSPVWSQAGKPSVPLLIHGLSRMNLGLLMFRHQTILLGSTGSSSE
jgi:hypothetical protein